MQPLFVALLSDKGGENLVLFFIISSTMSRGRGLKATLRSAFCAFFLLCEYFLFLYRNIGSDVFICFLCYGYFLTPPSCGHLPYILLCKTQRRRLILFCVLCLFFSPAESRSIAGSCRAIGETQRNGSDDERG